MRSAVCGCSFLDESDRSVRYVNAETALA